MRWHPATCFYQRVSVEVVVNAAGSHRHALLQDAAATINHLRQTASETAFSIRAFTLVPFSFALAAALRWSSGLMRRERVPE